MVCLEGGGGNITGGLEGVKGGPLIQVFRLSEMRGVHTKPGYKRDKTMADKLMHFLKVIHKIIPSVEVETFRHST